MKMIIVIVLLCWSCIGLGESKSILDGATNPRTPADIDKLDFKKLLSVAKTGEHLASVAADAYSQKYTNYEVELRDSLPQYLPQFDSEDPIHVYGNQLRIITVYNLRLSLDTLKYFGQVIQKLKVYFGALDDENARIISKFIQEYCSTTLEQFDLVFLEPNSLIHFTEPLKSVKSLSFETNAVELQFNESICDLFPGLNNLTMTIRWDVDGQFINCHLASLKHLDLKLLYQRNEDHLIKFIKQNNQIESLKLVGVSKNFLKTVNKLLPNLQSLDLEELHGFDGDSTGEVGFGSVKSFKMAHETAPGDLSFANLENVCMHYNVDGIDDWMEFLQKHESIRRITIDGCRSIEENFSLAQLTQKLKNLEAVSIECEFVFTVDDVLKFVKNHEQLKEFRFAMCSNDDQLIIRQALDQDWHLDNYENGLMMTKKE